MIHGVVCQIGIHPILHLVDGRESFVPAICGSCPCMCAYTEFHCQAYKKFIKSSVAKTFVEV